MAVDRTFDHFADSFAGFSYKYSHSESIEYRIACRRNHSQRQSPCRACHTGAAPASSDERTRAAGSAAHHVAAIGNGPWQDNSLNDFSTSVSYGACYYAIRTDSAITCGQRSLAAQSSRFRINSCYTADSALGTKPAASSNAGDDWF